MVEVKSKRVSKNMINWAFDKFLQRIRLAPFSNCWSHELYEKEQSFSLPFQRPSQVSPSKSKMLHPRFARKKVSSQDNHQ